MVSPIYDTHFAETLSTAMNDFHEALTKRWREKYIEAIKDDSYDYPTVIERPTAPSAQQPWEAHGKAARCHIVFGDCSYIKWVEGGQEGSLSAVTCDGYTGVDEPTEVPGTPADGGGMVTVPPHISCGIGDNLKLIDQWAYGERDNVYYKLPLFDTQDLHKLASAYDAFIKIGTTLGLERGPGSDSSVGTFPPMDERELVGRVTDVSSERSEGQDFWAGWTGLSASRAKAGFFASVTPTLNNQSGVAGSLANMYSVRAAIVEKGRNDALYWAQWATKSCDEKTTVTTDFRDGWAVVTGIGYTATAVSAWSGVGAAVGATVSLVGFLGEKLIPEIKHEEYKYEIEEIVNHLNAKVEDLNKTLDDLEREYSHSITKLQGEINGINSYNLELYDLTQNSPSGDHGADPEGYTANVDGILKIGQRCYQAGDGYNDLISVISNTTDADKDLADKDGTPTDADKTVLDVRDQLKGFLSTSTGRYIVAGNEVKNAAEAYARTDSEQEAAFQRVMADWKETDVGDIDVHGDHSAKDLAHATDRSDYGGAESGSQDADDYVTDGG